MAYNADKELDAISAAIENACESFKILRDHVHGLREDIRSYQAEHAWNTNQAPRQETAPLGARGEATNGVTVSTNTPRISDPRDPRWADPTTPADVAQYANLRYVIKTLHAALQATDEVMYEHGDNAYKKGCIDGATEARTEMESVTRKLKQEIEALKSETVTLMAAKLPISHDLRSQEFLAEGVNTTKIVELQRQVEILLEANKGLAGDFEQERELRMSAERNVAAVLQREDHALRVLGLHTSAKHADTDRLQQQLENVRSKNTALEHINSSLRVASGHATLVRMLRHKRIKVFHNYKGEHNRVMDFSPTCVDWPTSADEPYIVGKNNFSEQRHSFVYSEIDSWSIYA